MPSEAAKKKAAQKREKKQAASRSAQKKFNAAASSTTGSSADSTSGETKSTPNGACALVETHTNGINGLDELKPSARSCTGECYFKYSQMTDCLALVGHAGSNLGLLVVDYHVLWLT